MHNPEQTPYFEGLFKRKALLKESRRALDGGYRKLVRLRSLVPLTDVTPIYDLIAQAKGAEFASIWCSSLLKSNELKLPEEDLLAEDQYSIRSREMFALGARHLWPWLLLHHDHSHLQTIVAEYLQRYEKFAAQVGLYPFAPSVENAHLQRGVNHKYRIMAMQLYVWQLAMDGNMTSPTAAVKPIATALLRSWELFSAQSLDVLQAVVEKTTHVSARVASPEELDGWNDQSLMALRLIDRGLREIVITYYGLLRPLHAQSGGPLPSSVHHLQQAIMSAPNLAELIERVMRQTLLPPHDELE